MEDKFKRTEYHLYNYKDIDKLNRLDEIKIKQLENDITLSAVQYDKDSISPTNAFHSNVEDEVIKREEHNIKQRIEYLKAGIVKRNLEKELIDRSLDLFEKEERRLIEIRYFTPGNIPPSWDSIALTLSIGRTTCIEMRKKIIYKLSDLII